MFMAYYLFDNFFEGGRESEKVYFLYTDLKVDNDGWPLETSLIQS